MIDVNMGWDADTAIQAGRRLDEYDPYWLEEPVVAEDFAGYRRIAEALRTRVVGGESHFTRNDLRPFFEAPHNVPILQPDPMRGGYSELRKIAAAAEPWGITIAPHLFHEQMVHVLASIPNASYLEYMDWNDDLWVEPLKPNKNGTMTPPERPGHGLAFKPEVLKDHKIGESRMTGMATAPATAAPPVVAGQIAAVEIVGGTTATQTQSAYAGNVGAAASPGGAA
jgi:L-alanine-DL-glutamate epimerase-like enolase superfamily enzyme